MSLVPYTTPQLQGKLSNEMLTAFLKAANDLLMMTGGELRLQLVFTDSSGSTTVREVVLSAGDDSPYVWHAAEQQRPVPFQSLGWYIHSLAVTGVRSTLEAQGRQAFHDWTAEAQAHLTATTNEVQFYLTQLQNMQHTILTQNADVYAFMEQNQQQVLANRQQVDTIGVSLMFQRLQQQSTELNLKRLETKLQHLEELIVDTSRKVVALQSTGQEQEMEKLNREIRLQTAEHATITRKCEDLERRLAELAINVQQATSAEQTARQQQMHELRKIVTELTAQHHTDKSEWGQHLRSTNLLLQEQQRRHEEQERTTSALLREIKERNTEASEAQQRQQRQYAALQEQHTQLLQKFDAAQKHAEEEAARLRRAMTDARMSRASDDDLLIPPAPAREISGAEEASVYSAVIQQGWTQDLTTMQDHRPETYDLRSAETTLRVVERIIGAQTVETLSHGHADQRNELTSLLQLARSKGPRWYEKDAGLCEHIQKRVANIRVSNAYRAGKDTRGILDQTRLAEDDQVGRLIMEAKDRRPPAQPAPKPGGKRQGNGSRGGSQ